MCVNMTSRSELPWSFEFECDSARLGKRLDNHTSTRAKAEVTIDDFGQSNEALEEPESNGGVNIVGQRELALMSMDGGAKKCDKGQELVEM